MRVTLCTYSATGNTTFLVDALEEGLKAEGAETVRVDMADLESARGFDWGAVDRVVFAFPVMVFRPALVARRFLEALPAPTSPVDAYLLVTSAGMPANSPHTYAVQLAQKNISVRVATHIRCEDSFIPFRKWFKLFSVKGKPDQESASTAKAFAKEITNPPADMPEGIALNSLNPLYYVGQNAPEDAARAMLGKRHLDKERCTACGVCVGGCPTEALKMEQDLPVLTDKNLCIGCCACFNTCPEAAWALDRFSAGYYYTGVVGGK
jgi:ferredoxin